MFSDISWLYQIFQEISCPGKSWWSLFLLHQRSKVLKYSISGDSIVHVIVWKYFCGHERSEEDILPRNLSLRNSNITPLFISCYFCWMLQTQFDNILLSVTSWLILGASPTKNPQVSQWGIQLYVPVAISQSIAAGKYKSGFDVVTFAYSIGIFQHPCWML